MSDIRYKQVGKQLHVTRDRGWGLKVTTIYEPVAEFHDRTACYCCTCLEDSAYPDVYCRNHGWAGTRPCEEHGQSGALDDDGHMPESVQVIRERRKALKDHRQALLEAGK